MISFKLHWHGAIALLQHPNRIGISYKGFVQDASSHIYCVHNIMCNDYEFQSETLTNHDKLRICVGQGITNVVAYQTVFTNTIAVKFIGESFQYAYISIVACTTCIQEYNNSKLLIGTISYIKHIEISLRAYGIELLIP